MTKLLLPIVLIMILSLAGIACSDDDEPSPSPTVPPAGGTVAPNPSPPASSTRFPPVEGTVDPLGFGGTEDITVKPLPDPPAAQALLRAVRVGAHPEQGGWDRIVFEFENQLPPAEIHYETAAVQCGSGFPVRVQGSAVLLVEFEVASAHTEAGQPTVAVRDIPGPGNAILQSVQICDFEAHVDWAVGTRGMQRFKVTRLANPTRLVIDVKHP
jgi:hypothetical protein